MEVAIAIGLPGSPNIARKRLARQYGHQTIPACHLDAWGERSADSVGPSSVGPIKEDVSMIKGRIPSTVNAPLGYKQPTLEQGAASLVIADVNDKIGVLAGFVS